MQEYWWKRATFSLCSDMSVCKVCIWYFHVHVFLFRIRVLFKVFVLFRDMQSELMYEWLRAHSMQGADRRHLSGTNAHLGLSSIDFFPSISKCKQVSGTQRYTPMKYSVSGNLDLCAMFKFRSNNYIIVRIYFAKNFHFLTVIRTTISDKCI